MITIKDALGPKWNTIRLYDDNSTPWGGLMHSEETLGEFMLIAEMSPFDSIGELQKGLKECGLKQLEIADRHVEEIIQQRIWDIEEELGINVCDWEWDYKEING